MAGTALVGLGAVGAALHILGSIFIVFGQASVKVAHSIIDSTGLPSTWEVPRAHPHPPLWRRPDGKWRRQKAGSKAYAYGGWAAFTAGNILRFVAMRFAAQTVLSGLGSLQFVIIPLASRIMLGIRASGSTALGVTVVLLGNALIMAYGPAEVTFTLEQLRHQWATPAMTTFMVALGSLLCVLQWLYWRLNSATGGSAGGGLQPQIAAVMSGGGAGGGGKGDFGNAGGSLEGVSGSVGDARYLASAGSGKWVGGGGGAGGGGEQPDAVIVFVGALLFSAVASFVGAWSVLFSKSLTYVVTYMPASLTDWYSWFILAAFLGTAAFWVRQSDRGLRYYPASLIMPLMQAFWMCMSVLEGGIYFDELTGLPSRHLALLVLGLVLALLGAIFMGIAGFIAEKPEHIFHYSAASSDLDASDACACHGGSGALSPPLLAAAATATVSVIVEDKQHWAGTGRSDQLSNPVLRSGGGGGGGGGGGQSHKNGFAIGGATSSDDAEQGLGKPWWRAAMKQQQQQQQHGSVMRVHAMADGLPLHLELPLLGGATTPLRGTSPSAALERLQAVCSPTQQLLSRENSECLEAAGAPPPNPGSSAFDRALLEAADGSGSGGLGRQDTILLDGRSGSSGGGGGLGKAGLQRR